MPYTTYNDFPINFPPTTIYKDDSLRFRFLNILKLLLHHLQTVGHALFELGEGSDAQLLLDLSKLLLLLVEFLTNLLDLVLKLYNKTTECSKNFSSRGSVCVCVCVRGGQQHNGTCSALEVSLSLSISS